MNKISNILKDKTTLHPNKTAFIFPNDGVSISYKELYQRSQRMAAWLQKKHQPGEQLLIALPHTLDYIIAFYGCWAAGMVAVPAPLADREANKKRFVSIMENCKPELIITDEKQLGKTRQMAKGVSVISFLEMEFAATSYRVAKTNQLNDLALIQFTSGSISQPKGVCISHKNLISNSEDIKNAYYIRKDFVSINWLPFFHDMGLIGNIVQTVFSGITSVNITPQQFLQRPLTWLELVGEYKATAIGGPGFAFDLCVEKIKEKQVQQLDLRSLQLIYCGAEVIHPARLMRFFEKFKSQGLRLHSFFPSYGLAESTLMVCGRKKTPESKPNIIEVKREALKKGRIVFSSDTDHALLGNGLPVNGSQIEIRNLHNLSRCAPDEIGEVWIKGQSVARGYFQQPDVKENTFRKDNFLRTGDLGFLHEKVLYITGRIKELVIVKGQNYFPADLEEAVQSSHEALQINGTAIFKTIKDEEEQIIVVQELKRKYCQATPSEEIFKAIQKALSEQFELSTHTIVLLSPFKLPRTTSGKIQRLAAKAAFESEVLEYLYFWQKPNHSPTAPQVSPIIFQKEEIKECLLQLLVDKISVDISEVNLDEPLTNYGLDSMNAMEIVVELEIQFDLVLDPTLLWQFPTINGLVDYCFEQVQLSQMTLMN